MTNGEHGYTIVVEFTDFDGETTTSMYGFWTTYGDMAAAMEQVNEAAEGWPQDPEADRVVSVNWRALRTYDQANMNDEVRNFIGRKPS